MSKNVDRYKEDLSHLDIEVFDEIETPKFEKFQSKNGKSAKKEKQGKKNGGKKDD